MVVYDTTLNTLSIYNGTSWGGTSGYWSASSNTVYPSTGLTLQASTHSGPPFNCTSSTLGAEYYDTSTNQPNMCTSAGWTGLVLPTTISTPSGAICGNAYQYCFSEQLTMNKFCTNLGYTGIITYKVSGYSDPVALVDVDVQWLQWTGLKWILEADVQHCWPMSNCHTGNTDIVVEVTCGT
jgi:hypothetical protein